jgi:hypothetical protein
LRIKLNNPKFSFKKVTNKKEVTLKLTRKQASEIHYWLEYGSDALNPDMYYEDKSENQIRDIRKKRVHSILKMLDKYSIDNSETLEIG